MASTLYPTGLASAFVGWGTTGVYGWALALNSYTPSLVTDVYLSDVAGYEPSDGSYTRQSASGELVIVDVPLAAGFTGFVRFQADEPVWTAITGGESIGWILLYEFVTTDFDSPLVAAIQASWYTTGSNFSPSLGTNGAFRISTACPAVE